VSPDEDVGTVPNLVDIVGSPNGEVLSVLIDKRGQFSPTKPKVQIHPAALPLDLINLALAVVLATSLEGEQLGVPRKRLEGRQHVSYGHAPSVATTTR
jgi:hypothetical protein